jgi:protein-L-isoaspartate(D-aspartate) O-methyltransferase
MLLAAFGTTALAAAEPIRDDRAADRASMVLQLTARRQTAAGGLVPPPSLGGNDKGAGPRYGSVRVDNGSDRAIRNAKVIDAMGSVPRHLFVPPELQREAYADRPLPIGYGQTISQPYIVALMTELLDPQEGWKVLEIGTGSGYQAALLTKFTSNIYTIEIVEPLHKQALQRLKQFGLGADRVLHGDGYFGIEKAAPFDGIIVTAAADHIPPPLIQQLRPGGRMVLPIGPVHATQRLVVVEKDAAGKVRTQTHHPVRFVPLTGGPAR